MHNLAVTTYELKRYYDYEQNEETKQKWVEQNKISVKDIKEIDTTFVIYMKLALKHLEIDLTHRGKLI